MSTSQHEGFGLVFLEAMAFGLPIVCYDRGGQTDFLATPDDRSSRAAQRHPGFNDAVRALRDSPEQRAAIRRHNLARVEDFFIERCAERYERLFEARDRRATHSERAARACTSMCGIAGIVGRRSDAGRSDAAHARRAAPSWPGRRRH